MIERIFENARRDKGASAGTSSAGTRSEKGLRINERIRVPPPRANKRERERNLTNASYGRNAISANTSERETRDKLTKQSPRTRHEYVVAFGNVARVHSTGRG